MPEPKRVTLAKPPEYTFDLSGGLLCFDFTNTMSGSRAEPKEHLHNYADLVSWGRQAGALTEQEARRLDAAAERRPGDADRTLAEAIRFREALFRIFAAAAAGGRPQTDDMNLLNTVLSRALAQVRLDATAEGCVRAWGGEADALDRMLWPVARSTMDLLTSERRKRIRRCESPDCDWLFLDMTRNHSRRWCDMKTCGNRAKARRYYERHKTKGS